MNRQRPYLNRLVKQKEKEREDCSHWTNLKEIKPRTVHLSGHATIVINHSKKEKLIEERITQIERQNKILLGKIESMAKKSSRNYCHQNQARGKVNHSLNETYRRRWVQDIELENTKLLLRLQAKKPTYNTQKFRRDWCDKKSVIRRLSNFDFHIANLQSFGKTAMTSKGECGINNQFSRKIVTSRHEGKYLNRLANIDGVDFTIKVEMTKENLKIIGKQIRGTQLKVIQIPREEGELFIDIQCQGQFEALVDKLRYSQKEETLYLMREMEAKEGQTFRGNLQYAGEQNPERNYQTERKHRSKKVMLQGQDSPRTINNSKVSANNHIKRRTKQKKRDLSNFQQPEADQNSIDSNLKHSSKPAEEEQQHEKPKSSDVGDKHQMDSPEAIMQSGQTKEGQHLAKDITFEHDDQDFVQNSDQIH